MAKIKRVCQRCGTVFETEESEVRRGGGKYCSRPCYYGQKIKRKCKTCGTHFYVTESQLEDGANYCSPKCFHQAPQSAETRKRRSDSHKKVIHTSKWRANQSKALTGREIKWADKIREKRTGYKVPLEERQARSEFSRGMNNPAYIHGLSPVQFSVRKSMRYREWRISVYKRDRFIDQITGEPVNGRGNVHHRIPFSDIWARNNLKTFKDAMNCQALWDINNGVTMRSKTHEKFHTLFENDCPSIEESIQREKEFRKRMGF